MKHKYNYGYMLSVVNEDDNMLTLVDQFGYIFEKEELIDIANKILFFCEKYGDSIEEYNEKTKEEENYKRLEKTPKPKTKGFIYIMKCENKYKIGFTKNIDKRLKQLNNRPFPVELYYLSKEIEDVYNIEKFIHSKISKYKIDGEWYDFKEIDIKNIVILIEKIIEKNNLKGE